MSKVLLCLETLLSIKARDWSEMFSSWRQTCLGARQTTQRALVILSCSFGSLVVWCFGSSTSPRHQRLGARGHFTFIRLYVSQPNFNPIAMATVPMSQGKSAGVHCVLCRSLEGTGSTLVFRILFLFMPVEETSSKKVNDIFGSFWLVRSSVWSICGYSVLHRHMDVLQIKGMGWHFCISVGRCLFYKHGN